MLGNRPFYWQHIKKYISVFGTLFNDISIVREVNGKEKTIKVPLMFSEKEKTLGRLKANPELRNQWRQIVPRMGFDVSSPMYDPSRKDNASNMRHLSSDGKQRTMQYPPAPYNFVFTLNIITEYYEDGLQIVEQILPFFQPDYFVSVDEIPQLELKRDVSISLTSVIVDDQYEGDFENKREIVWSLEFVLKGYLYGPEYDREVIKKALVEYSFDPDAEPVLTYTAEVVPFTADRGDPHEIVETKT